MSPADFALKYGPQLGKSLFDAFTDAAERKRALALTHEKAESTLRFHVATAKKHAAKRGAKK